jgi:intracellular septation protein
MVYFRVSYYGLCRMKLLFDFFPILVFFLAYRFLGLYEATALAMIASVLQVVFYRITHSKYEKMHLISLAIIIVLGGATLFFHNPWFIKWKPTAIYWITSIALFVSTFWGNKTLIQKMMEGNIQLSKPIWKRLTYAWSSFFMFMGGLNLYVAYYYSTNTWVNFKLFGTLGLTLFFVLIQASYLTRHIIPGIQQTLKPNRELN